ncbi:MAG: neutral zinc metallopeptidase, partial [Bacteroidales bacterium]|nr:neutral zinc metallopeptidase [Bacteroidales bacterium]
MKLDGRRVSTNVDDRRGRGGAAKATGLGLGGIIIVGVITLLLGGDPVEVINDIQQMGGLGTELAEGYSPSAEEEELAVFAKQILAGTEDVWSAIFEQNGLQYTAPKLVLFSGSVQS